MKSPGALLLKGEARTTPAAATTAIDWSECMPDSILLIIFNKVSDIKTLTRCRSLSRRFNSLARQTDSLLFIVLPSLKPPPNLSQILRCFSCVRTLRIEFEVSSSPSDDDDSTRVLKWKAQFGRLLKSCVILAFRDFACDDSSQCGLKRHLISTINVLIAATSRLDMMIEVINDQKTLEYLVIQDSANQGRIEMDKHDLEECRNGSGDDVESEINHKRSNVATARLRMWQVARMELSGGITVEDAALVVVRPKHVRRDNTEDVEMAMAAFEAEGVYKEAVERLLMCRFHEMETF